MYDLYVQVLHWMNSFDKQEWLLVLIGAVVLGHLLLRGFGSRSDY
jgi:hypothetical protein